MYIIAGPIGSGITEVVTEIWEELYSKGLRSVRKVYGRPDGVETSSAMTEAEIIATIEADLINSVNSMDLIISGTEINRHVLAIRRHWETDSKVIFVRKQDSARALEAGLSLLEHHVNFDRTAYSTWMQEQIDLVNGAAESVSAEWKDVAVLNMFEFNPDKLVDADSMSNDPFTIKEYTGVKSQDCVPRQLSIY